jgi:hypothetical protein
MKQDYCDVAKHEKQKLEVTRNMINIMAQATKHTKFAAYAEPDFNAALLTEDQYVELTQDQHTVEEWNRIILALSKGYFATASEYDEIKQKASRSSGFSKAFTPRKRVKIQDQDQDAARVFLGNWTSQ